jgi:hypothetical protein
VTPRLTREQLAAVPIDLRIAWLAAIRQRMDDLGLNEDQRRATVFNLDDLPLLDEMKAEICHHIATT